MSHKAIWRAPQRVIPDLGFVIDPGDEFEIPEQMGLGGEGVNFDIVGGPAFEAIQAEAKDLGVKGAAKMTRLQLEQAISLKQAAEAEAAEADKEGTDS